MVKAALPRRRKVPDNLQRGRRIRSLGFIVEKIIRTQRTRGSKDMIRNDRKKIPVGARLLRFRSSWQGAHHESIIKVGVSWSWKKKPPPLKRLKQRTSPSLDKIVATLRKRRVIEKAKKLMWQSRLFTVPKNSEEDRLILDLSILNEFIKCPTFKMLNLKEVKLLLPKDYWTISLDLKDGFWHLGVAKTKRPYLGFTYRNQDWQFRAMPFGLNIAPRTFTKVIAHVVKVMANKGIWCLPYLDDLLILAPSRKVCLEKAELAITILETMGWIINYKKSRLEPAQVFEWLGVQFDLVNHTALASSEKRECLQSKLTGIITSRECTKREIMQLQGQANWIAQCDPITRLMLAATRYILKSLRRCPLDAPIILNRGMKLFLCSWVKKESIPQALGSPAPNLLIQSDAHPGGWGFQINRTKYRGEFDSSMDYPINVLEALTVWYALLVVKKKGLVIHIKCDNEVAVSVIRKGKSRVFHLQAIANLIWRRAALMRWTISISHIKGEFNVIADQLSRNVPLSTEWSIPKEDFKEILALNPDLEVDLFATHLNFKIESYMSPCPDEGAVGIDALSTSWDHWNHLYLYPPAKLISKVLAKMKHTQFHSAILITQDLPTRPWYMALKMSRVPSRKLETRLQQIVNGRLITDQRKTVLRVWMLSKQHMVTCSQEQRRQ